MAEKYPRIVVAPTIKRARNIGKQLKLPEDAAANAFFANLEAYKTAYQID